MTNKNTAAINIDAINAAAQAAAAAINAAQAAAQDADEQAAAAAIEQATAQAAEQAAAAIRAAVPDAASEDVDATAAAIAEQTAAAVVRTCWANVPAAYSYGLGVWRMSPEQFAKLPELSPRYARNMGKLQKSFAGKARCKFDRKNGVCELFSYGVRVARVDMKTRTACVYSYTDAAAEKSYGWDKSQVSLKHTLDFLTQHGVIDPTEDGKLQPVAQVRKNAAVTVCAQ